VCSWFCRFLGSVGKHGIIKNNRRFACFFVYVYLSISLKFRKHVRQSKRVEDSCCFCRPGPGARRPAPRLVGPGPWPTGLGPSSRPRDHGTHAYGVRNMEPVPEFEGSGPRDPRLRAWDHGTHAYGVGNMEPVPEFEGKGSRNSYPKPLDPRPGPMGSRPLDGS